MKATANENCSLCEKRRGCWNSDRYGDRGERGKKPYPDKGVCQSFKYDKNIMGY